MCPIFCEQNLQAGFSTIMQGLFVLFAHVGSGDSMRVLHLYTMNTLNTLWSIYCWDICTTCRYRTYVLCYGRMCPSRVLTTNWTPTLHSVVSFIVTCVDIGRTVFRDCSATSELGAPLKANERPQTRLLELPSNDTYHKHIFKAMHNTVQTVLKACTCD